MTSAVLEPDASGTFVCSSFMLATARDWARFGQLFLQNQPVTCEYRLAAPAAAQPAPPRGLLPPAPATAADRERWARDTLVPHHGDDGDAANDRVDGARRSAGR